MKACPLHKTAKSWLLARMEISLLTYQRRMVYIDGCTRMRAYAIVCFRAFTCVPLCRGPREEMGDQVLTELCDGGSLFDLYYGGHARITTATAWRFASECAQASSTKYHKRISTLPASMDVPLNLGPQLRLQ